MRNLLAGSLAVAALSFALGGPALAATDPTVHQIYEAASSGHLDQAQQMMDEVLRDHPTSAKAHYVQSELYAREGKLGPARAELARAEQPAQPPQVAAKRSQVDADLAAGHRREPPLSARAPARARCPGRPPPTRR